MDFIKIVCEASNLQKHIWRQKEHLWPEHQPLPIDMLKPEVAAHVLGLSYSQSESLAHQPFNFRGQKFKTAGLLDRQRKAIVISTDSLETMKYTGAHEIGHWILHPNEVMHRDRPINTNYTRKDKRPRIEKEADYFAACFLMPPNLLTDYFTRLYQCDSQFVFDENTAFHLDSSNSYQLLDVSQDSLDRELALARCTSFNGQYFKSLAATFGVSNSAMAIRIKELQLIRWP